MALIQCAECKQIISDQATSCPHCGFPLVSYDVNTQKKSSVAYIVVTIIGCIVLGIGCFCMIIGFGVQALILFLVGAILMGISKILN